MKKNLLTVLQNSKKYTLSVAEAMPVSMYLFGPSPDVWNFKELMNHIAYGITWWENNYIKNIETPWSPPAIKENKQDILVYLNQAYDSLKDTVSRAHLHDDLVKGFHSTLDHITHHRGQAVVYLRCKGITPPEYIY